MSPGLALDSDCGTSRGARGECGKKRRHSKADRGKRGTKCKRVEKGADARPKTGEPDAVARTPPCQVGAVGNAPPGETGASGSTQTPPRGSGRYKRGDRDRGAPGLRGCRSVRWEMVDLIQLAGLLSGNSRPQNPSPSASDASDCLDCDSSSRSPSPVRQREKCKHSTPWPTKAARKQGAKDKNKRALVQPDSPRDPGPDDREDGEYLSNDEEVAVCPEESFSRFFSADDYQYLLCKSLSALELKPRLDGDKTKEPDFNPKTPRNKYWGSADYFPQDSSVEKVFPFPVFFEKQLKAEWADPTANRQCSGAIKKLYNLPAFANKMLQVPLDGHHCF